MSVTSIVQGVGQGNAIPPLEPGDHMDRETFHARYSRMPENVKAELIGGVVYMPAALRSPHGRFHGILMTWMGNYWIGTPGTDFLDNATVFLGNNSQPQPDACLRIPGGQSSENDDEYIVGPPELVAEIASSTESYDLHTKRFDYDRWGVTEYLVFVVSERRVVRFVRQTSGLVELSADSDGILRSTEFPGLWLDPNAFFNLNGQRIVEVLNQGLASAEHAAFVARLAKSAK